MRLEGQGFDEVDVPPGLGSGVVEVEFGANFISYGVSNAVDQVCVEGSGKAHWLRKLGVAC